MNIPHVGQQRIAHTSGVACATAWTHGSRPMQHECEGTGKEDRIVNEKYEKIPKAVMVSCINYMNIGQTVVQYDLR